MAPEAPLFEPIADLLHAPVGPYNVEQLLVGGAVVLAGIWAFRKMYQAAVG